MTNFTPNREFRIVFQPKAQELFGNRRRFFVGAGRLAEYVGRKNAATALRRAMESQGDKVTVKFRKMGRVDFYVK